MRFKSLLIYTVYNIAYINIENVLNDYKNCLLLEPSMNYFIDVDKPNTLRVNIIDNIT